MSLAAHDLVGTWELVEWTWQVDGRTRGHPMGPDARGRLTYTPDGVVAAVLCFTDRPPLDAALLHKAPVAERDRAALTYVSYHGTWDLEGDRVVHHVDFALLPDWVGTDLVRLAAYDGECLVLTTEPEATSEGAAVNRLCWRRRASAASPSAPGPS